VTIFVFGTATVRVTVFVSSFAIFFVSATTLLLVPSINSSAAHFVSSSARSISPRIAFNGRVSAWRQNLEREGAFDSESIKELKGKIGRSFDGLPDLTGVNSMNDLLDK
jgi:hypothetical protein